MRLSTSDYILYELSDGLFSKNREKPIFVDTLIFERLSLSRNVTDTELRGG